MSKKQQALRQNLRVPGLVRDEVRDGTRFLVVPVVMLQEQVLFCANCHPDGEFISSREIMASLAAWDNRPITLSHPTYEWSPANFQRLEVGRVFNAFWDGKLKAEMWLNLTALKSSMKGREVERRFREGEVTEVSTGYFVDRNTRRGKFQGTSFALEQIGIVPDHLAILTDEVGACSIAGGCGAPRLNSNGEESMDETKLLRRFLKFLKLMKDEDDETDDSQSTDGNDAGGVTININAGTAVTLDEGKSLDTATEEGGGLGNQKTSDEGGSSMDEKQKQELVKRLLASEKVSTFEEKALLAMTDDQLLSLATLAGCGCAGEKTENESDGEKTADDAGKEGESTEGDGTKDGDVTFTSEDAKFVTALRAASGGTVEGLTALMEAGKQEAERRKTLKTNLVTQLNKDEKVAMSEAVLNSMSLEALEGLDRSLNPMSYAGRGGPRLESRTEEADVFAPDAPAVVLQDVGKGDDES